LATWDDIRAVALALPGVTESLFHGDPWLTVGSRGFVQTWRGRVLMKLDKGRQELLFEARPDVFSPMVAGRLRWREAGATVPGKVGLAAFDFAPGTLVLTEASSKKRASLALVKGEEGVRAADPGGIEPMDADVEAFAAALRRENHTVKRALTDPRLLSGIGNAYSDEILWRAQMSPVRLTQRLTDDEIARLREATQTTLREWTERLARDAGDDFPAKVTAFRDEMAVHGRYKKPCPRCGAPVQRIAYAENEANYCARCQTNGKLLADRGLSRLLRGDWPKTLDELETRMRRAKDAIDPRDAKDDG